MDTWNLSALLAPQSTESFYRDFLGKFALLISSAPDKWKHILSWDDISGILTYSGIISPRLRLYKAGVEVSTDTYQTDDPSGYPRLRLLEVNRQLREGATLVIDSADSLKRTVSELCRGVEQDLSVPVQANLFVTCLQKSAGKLLWNDYDMFVLQVSGATLWRIYGPTTPFATKVSLPPEPAGSPAWETSLASGYLLYVPRGYWYSETTDGGAEFHLRMMFRNPTALDVVYRLVDELNSVPKMRMDYPIFGDADSQSRCLTMILHELSKIAEGPGVIRGFLNDMRVISDPRAQCGLPWSALSDISAAPKTLEVIPMVRFLIAETVHRASNENDVEVFHAGRNVRFNNDVGSLFEHICLRCPIPLGEVLMYGERTQPQAQVFENLDILLRHDLIVLREPRNLSSR
ncbi:MAG TPA: cupin domain-containing protein [Bryobacteraceae bacterium]|jgi:hypothetical protein|nr:cupin domain-containing protein [Bryobacteraceae bacterium]